MSVVRSSTEKISVIPRESHAKFIAVNALHPRFGAILVFVVYCQPQTSHFDQFFAEVEDILSSTDHCVLMGDFNYDLQSDGDALDFMDILSSLGFNLPPFHHTSTDHHGCSELDILASFGLTELKHDIGSAALVGGHVPLIVNFRRKSCEPYRLRCTH